MDPVLYPSSRPRRDFHILSFSVFCPSFPFLLPITTPGNTTRNDRFCSNYCLRLGLEGTFIVALFFSYLRDIARAHAMRRRLERNGRLRRCHTERRCDKFCFLSPSLDGRLEGKLSKLSSQGKKNKNNCRSNPRSRGRNRESK